MNDAPEPQRPPGPIRRDRSASTFFRQSGWMLLATVLGGVFMFAVHKVAARMPKAEYGVFTTLLQVFNLMQIPAIGLQTIFAQQTVTAFTDESRRQLTSAVRVVALATFLIWLVIFILPMLVVIFGPIYLIFLGIRALVRRNRAKKQARNAPPAKK